MLQSVALAAFLISFALPANADKPAGWYNFGTRSTQSAPTPVGYFPSIQAEALDKSSILIPSQLEGRLNLVLLSWARDQSPQLDTWEAVGQALQHTHTDFRVYRMPVNDNENSLFQWWDNASLRAQESDPQLLHWDVPLYTDKAALVLAIGLPKDEKQVVALLIDQSGRILWKSQGPSTEQTRFSLIQAAGGIR
jgi:hypothetical protein